jgi:hypothetical protein
MKLPWRSSDNRTTCLEMAQHKQHCPAVQGVCRTSAGRKSPSARAGVLIGADRRQGVRGRFAPHGKTQLTGSWFRGYSRLTNATTASLGWNEGRPEHDLPKLGIIHAPEVSTPMGGRSQILLHRSRPGGVGAPPPMVPMIAVIAVLPDLNEEAAVRCSSGETVF